MTRGFKQRLCTYLLLGNHRARPDRTRKKTLISDHEIGTTLMHDEALWGVSACITGDSGNGEGSCYLDLHACGGKGHLFRSECYTLWDRKLGLCSDIIARVYEPYEPRFTSGSKQNLGICVSLLGWLLAQNAPQVAILYVRCYHTHRNMSQERG